MANSPARGAVDVGSVIADTYTIEALLGRGGMGSVFLASHKRLAGKRVAIKILHTELEDADVVARFKREAEIAAKLNHPNIVGVIDYNVAPDGMPYLVLDYLEGETLAQAIARGPMALERVLSIMRQVGSALAAAHRAGIVHRDLKPQNIFLVPTEVDGREVEIAKVLDFGISKIRGSQTVQTQEATLLGTPQYMAPEQALGQHVNVDERTDVFALGAIVYEMLSGQPAFAGASIPEVVFKVVYELATPLVQHAPGVPPSIVAAVDKAMAKPADERFATVAGFVEALTGQPLSVTRGQAIAVAPAAEVPSGSKRVTSHEAFDRTMGPGATDAGAVNPLLATAAPVSRSIAPGPPIVPAAVTVPHGAAPRPKRTGLIAALALVGVAAAGGAAYVVTRPAEHRGKQHARADRSDERPAVASTSERPDPRPSDRKPGDPVNSTKPGDIDPKPPDGKPTDPTPGDGKPTTPVDGKPTTPGDGKPTPPVADGGAVVPKPPKPPAHEPPPTQPGSPDGKLPKPHKPDPKPAGHPPRPPGPPPTPDSDGDDEIRDKLKQSRRGLERRDYDAAERIANAVINSPGTPKQRAAARLIHGQVQCLARNDQEAAQIDLRGLEGFRAMRARLLNVCRNHGVITGP